MGDMLTGLPVITAGQRRAKSLLLNPRPRQTNRYRHFMVAEKNSEAKNYELERSYNRRKR